MTTHTTTTENRMSNPSTVSLAAPLAGLPGRQQFTLTALDDQQSLYTLDSHDDGDPLRFYLVAPKTFFADYAPALNDEVRQALDVADDQAQLLAIVTPPAQSGGVPTANLLAPLVLNPSSGTAVQAILDGSEWPVRAPLA